MGVELAGKHNGNWDCEGAFRLPVCYWSIRCYDLRANSSLSPCCHGLMISHAQKMHVFEKRSTEWSFFLANAGLLETLVSLRNRTAKCSCVINLAGLLLMCFVVIFILKESEVWRKVISKQNYCHACLTRFAVFLPLPSCCISSLLRYEDGDGR